MDESPTWVLKPEAVRRSIQVLLAQRIHPYFPAYLHLVQRAAVEGRTAELRAYWKRELGPYLQVAGAAGSHPYYRPFWDGTGDAGRGQGWLNPNLSGSFAKSSLRAGQPALAVVRPEEGGIFSLREHHWELCREHLLFDKEVPAAPLAAWLFRDFGFQTDGGSPTEGDLVAVFVTEFGYGSLDNPEFEHLYSVGPMDGSGWFEPFESTSEAS